MNLPNRLTWLRISLIPFFVGLFYLPESWLATSSKNWLSMAIFLLGGLTDWLDGYLARKLQQTSAFGAFLDPVADKLMVSSALIILVTLNRADPILAVIIIGREIAISALREWMAQVGKSPGVAVALLGKIKTALQMVAITLLLLYEPTPLHLPVAAIGNYCLWMAAILTLWSMTYYLRAAWPYMR